MLMIIKPIDLKPVVGWAYLKNCMDRQACHGSAGDNFYEPQCGSRVVKGLTAHMASVIQKEGPSSKEKNKQIQMELIECMETLNDIGST